MASKKQQQKSDPGNKKKRRGRGTGGLYLRGDTWWMKYYFTNGRFERESCHTKTKEVAEGRLRKRLSEIDSGEFTSTDARKIKVAKLAEAFIRDYRLNGYKTLDDAERRWEKYLEPFFGHLCASSITSDQIDEYKEKRLDAGAANATVNRELGALKRMFAIAMESTPPKVARVPKITMLPENNVRTGFLTDDRYAKLADCCAKVGLWMRGIFEVGYTFGWRSAEITSLRVRQVEIANCRIVLDVGTTKSKEGRSVKFEPETILAELLTACCAGKSPDQYVFTRPDGKPVRNFRQRWYRVCCEAGEAHRVCRICGTTLDANLFCKPCNLQLNTNKVKTIGLLFHDLRRSAARNARAAGVAEGVIMKMSGWKTRTVFDRYAIVAEDDMDAAIKLIQKRRSQFGHSAPQTGPAQDKQQED